VRLASHLTHAALQTRAAKRRAAAHDRDDARMQDELRRFIDTLDEHLAAESSALDGLLPAATAEARAGQAHILLTVTTLLHGAAAGTERGGCEAVARELHELFERQDVIERRAFGNEIVAT
jgi:hypothetical protein